MENLAAFAAATTRPEPQTGRNELRDRPTPKPVALRQTRHSAHAEKVKCCQQRTDLSSRPCATARSSTPNFGSWPRCVGRSASTAASRRVVRSTNCSTSAWRTAAGPAQVHHGVTSRLSKSPAPESTGGLALVPRRAVGSAVRSDRGGNVVRQVRRSQPGVSGVRRIRRSSWSASRRSLATSSWRRPCRIQGLLRSARHVLSRGSCLIRPGSGCRTRSRARRSHTPDDRAAEIKAVMDAAGFGKAAPVTTL